MKQLLLIATVCIAIFTSCKDDNNDNALKPTVTITSPGNDADFKLIDTVNIVADISHTEDLHTYKVSIIKEETGSATILMDEHEHEKNVTVNTNFYLNESNHAHYYIIVSAEDHDGNAGADTVYIHSDN